MSGNDKEQRASEDSKTSEVSFLIPSLEQLPDIAERIILSYPDIRIFLLEGDMGAGKTTFAKAFCRVLGVKEEVSSPTYSIVHEYSGIEPIYHFDLYRLKNTDDLFQIGFEEYLQYPGYKLIEWSQIAIELIEDDYVQIRFEILEDGYRKLNCILTSS